MIDLSTILDAGTNLPETWKTIVREILLQFDNEAEYHHTNIAGNRPYTVELKITIDDPVDDETYEELHEKAKVQEKQMDEITELMKSILNSTPENFAESLEEIRNNLQKTQ